MSSLVKGLFGGQKTGSSESSSTVTIPSWLQPTVQNMTSRAEALSLQDYQPYTGQRFADFNADQLAAFQGVRDIQDTYNPLYEQAAGLIQQGSQDLTSADIQRYMDPYMQNVVDIQKREALKNFDIQQNQIGDMAVNSGAFGGDRHGILEAENRRGTQQLLNDIQSTGSQQAYQTGLTTAIGQQQNKINSGTALGGMAGAMQGSNLAGLTALSQIGQQQYAMDQAGRDFDYQQFVEGRNQPYANLEFLSGITNPILNATRGTSNTGATYGGKTSKLSGLLGLGSIIAAPFTGGSSLGLLGFKEGGKVEKEQSSGNPLLDILRRLEERNARLTVSEAPEAELPNAPKESGVDLGSIVGGFKNGAEAGQGILNLLGKFAGSGAFGNDAASWAYGVGREKGAMGPHKDPNALGLYAEGGRVSPPYTRYPDNPINPTDSRFLEFLKRTGNAAGDIAEVISPRNIGLHAMDLTGRGLHWLLDPRSELEGNPAAEKKAKEVFAKHGPEYEESQMLAYLGSDGEAGRQPTSDFVERLQRNLDAADMDPATRDNAKSIGALLDKYRRQEIADFGDDSSSSVRTKDSYSEDEEIPGFGLNEPSVEELLSAPITGVNLPKQDPQQAANEVSRNRSRATLAFGARLLASPGENFSTAFGNAITAGLDQKMKEDSLELDKNTKMIEAEIASGRLEQYAIANEISRTRQALEERAFEPKLRQIEAQTKKWEAEALQNPMVKMALDSYLKMYGTVPPSMMPDMDTYMKQAVGTLSGLYQGGLGGEEILGETPSYTILDE